MPDPLLDSEKLPQDFQYPEEFLEYISNQELKNGSLNGIPPWVFAAEETWALEESENLFGTKLIPFAQAEHQDKLAFFSAVNSDEVWEANPWEGVLLGKYFGFSEWLSKIKKESEKLVSDNPQYQENSFWFKSLNK